MLLNFAILCLCLATARATGQFSVLSTPKSISFKGSDLLQGQYVPDVLNAAMGYAVTGEAEWSGLYINDPFSSVKGVIAVFVDGVEHISVDSKTKTYELAGTTSDESLNFMSAELEASKVPVCFINFNDFEEGVNTFGTCFGDIDTSAVKKTKNLNPTLHSADKQFLQTIGYINAASDNLSAMKKNSNFLIFRLSLEHVAKAHGERSEALSEASKLVSEAITKLNQAAQKSSNSEALVIAVANKSDGGRVKRQAVPVNPKNNKLNLAEYYNEDYPVIFNIILWFMVVFGLSLLAISYAIGSMDPGRDSIIYRMTSTRMKKDN